MSNSDLKARYDEYQSDAVNAIVSDFSNDGKGRYLLVIPTGGGKTFTAVKAVCEMYTQGVLDPSSDRILWVAHRHELVQQASDTFESVILEKSLELKVGQHIKVDMVSTSNTTLSNDKSIKLIVIDEAHHAAAKSYKPMFEQTRAGVLGLTATPSRHDGLPLDFSKESYSIGFPELVKMGIILRPNIIEVRTGQYDIDGFTDDDLEQLNDSGRNQRIVQSIIENKNEFRKIIVYVGTKKHAKELCKLLSMSTIAKDYDSISYITGEENSRLQSRADFIQQEKKYKRSILVNVQVLSEGYDDPSVNTVIMATPSNSKLYYMQAMGRAIRQNPEDSDKKAFLVEVLDELPNIRYRIDNRWLFSDISDTLEPAVIDRTYSSSGELIDAITGVYDEYNVPEHDRHFPEIEENARYSMLLFNHYVGSDKHLHRSVLIDNNNRPQVRNAFNFMSERMTTYVARSINVDPVFKAIGGSLEGSRISKDQHRPIYDAMANACRCIRAENGLEGYLQGGMPWLTFVALNYRAKDTEIDPQFLKFIEDMVNRGDVIEKVQNHDYENGDVLLRLPQPLSKYVGIFVKSTTDIEIASIVAGLAAVKEKDDSDQFVNVSSALSEIVLPIEAKYAASLTHIVREEMVYRFEMEKGEKWKLT